MPTYIMLATLDGDIGLCDAEAMNEIGQKTANDLAELVTARDAVSDEVIATYKPQQVQ